jgi:hypothetical protein
MSTPAPVDIFFVNSSYNISDDGCVQFWTWINISAPLELFFAGQFQLEWDCNLLELRTTPTQNLGKGRIWNGSAWFTSNDNALNLIGHDSKCPEQGTYPAPNAQGRAAFLVAWDNYPDTHSCWKYSGCGINISPHPNTSLPEAKWSGIRWRTTGPACYGTTANTGITDILFRPTMMIVGYADGEYLYDDREVSWYNTSVLVGGGGAPTSTPSQTPTLTPTTTATSTATATASLTTVPTPTPTQTAQVWIEAPLNAGRCSNFSATVNISQVTGFDSANYDITYDPALLNVTAVHNGSIGATIIPVSDWGFIPAGEQGTIRVINNVGGVGGASGAGTLAVIDFDVDCYNCGNASLSFTGERVLYDNDSVEINATWLDDSVHIPCPT